MELPNRFMCVLTEKQSEKLKMVKQRPLTLERTHKELVYFQICSMEDIEVWITQ